MITTPKGPDGAAAIVHKALSRGGSRDRSIASNDETVSSTSHDFITQPHRIYMVSRDALLRGELLEAAQPVAWRYLVVRDDSAIAAVEIAGDRPDELEILSADRGWMVDDTVAALVDAEQLESVRNDTFELRLLRVPSVFFVALWLHGEDRDLLVPLPPTDPLVEPGTAYPPQNLISILRKRAEESAEFEGGEGT